MAARISALESKIRALSVETKTVQTKRTSGRTAKRRRRRSPAIAVQEPVPPEELIVKERVAPEGQGKEQAVKKEQPKESGCKTEMGSARSHAGFRLDRARCASSSELKQIQGRRYGPRNRLVKAIKQSKKLGLWWGQKPR